MKSIDTDTVPRRGKSTIIESAAGEPMLRLKDLIAIEQRLSPARIKLLQESGLFFVAGMDRLIVKASAEVPITMLLGLKNVKWQSMDIPTPDDPFQIPKGRAPIPCRY